MDVLPPPRLLDQVRDRLRAKHYHMRNEDAYVHRLATKPVATLQGSRDPACVVHRGGRMGSQIVH